MYVNVWICTTNAMVLTFFEDLIQQGDATNMFLATLGALVKPLRSQIGPAKPKTRDPR